jgi:hypothetical protein
MTSVCKNCHNHFKGNYCSTCGQAAETHELNFYFLWHDIQHGLLHFDKGIWFTSRELFTRPGNSIREYIEGKRVKHFKPISLVIILAGIYGVLFHYFHIDILATTITLDVHGQQAEELKQIVVELSEWVASHYAVVALLQLPVYAISTFLAFKKAGYNYVEHLVLNAFLTGQRLIVNILVFPLYYLVNGTEASKQFTQLVNTICIGLTIWALIQFFNKISKSSAFFRALFAYLIFIVISLIIMGTTALIVYSRFKEL